MQLKSPCFNCSYRDDNKNNSERCENCPERLAYIEQIGAKPAIDDQRMKLSEFVEPGGVIYFNNPDPKWCETENCGDLFYAKGLCRKHYDRMRRLGLDKYVSYEAGKTITIDFRDVYGGDELNELIRAISRHEHRSVRNQAMVLLEAGAHKWLEDTQNETKHSV